MRAALCTAYGPARDVLSVVDDAEAPSPERGEVLVRVIASSMNPLDARKRAGYGRALFERRRSPRFPWVLGGDVAGVVEATGPGATRFAVGDAVFGGIDPFGPGAHAERAALPEKHLEAKPRRLGFVEAASLPYAALSVWAALAGTGGAPMGRGRLAFVNGASGGVGSAAVQMLREWGWRVAATCGADNAAFVAGLGAETVIDYRSEDYAQRLSDVDLALDAVGEKAEGGEARLASILSPTALHATLVHPAASFFDRYGLVGGGAAAAVELGRRKLRYRGRDYRWALYKPNGAALSRIAEMIESGALGPTIGRAFGLDEIAAAHEAVEAGGGRGKIALRVGPEADEERVDFV